MNTGLTEDNYEALSRYRQERAHETLAEIPYLREQGYYNTAVNRLYYACYYAAVALMTKHHISTNTHAGVKMMLGLHFVSKGLITKESSVVTMTNSFITLVRKSTNYIPKRSDLSRRLMSCWVDE